MNTTDWLVSYRLPVIPLIFPCTVEALPQSSFSSRQSFFSRPSYLDGYVSGGGVSFPSSLPVFLWSLSVNLPCYTWACYVRPCYTWPYRAEVTLRSTTSGPHYAGEPYCTRPRRDHTLLEPYCTVLDHAGPYHAEVTLCWTMLDTTIKATLYLSRNVLDHVRTALYRAILS